MPLFWPRSNQSKRRKWPQRESVRPRPARSAPWRQSCAARSLRSAARALRGAAAVRRRGPSHTHAGHSTVQRSPAPRSSVAAAAARLPPSCRRWWPQPDRRRPSLGAAIVLHFFRFRAAGCPLRAGPSVLPRVALATTRRETRRPMTSKTTTAGSDADRQAVLDVLARVYQAWEAGDAEAFVADYTEDASVIQPGVYEKDREEIRTNIAAAFAGPLSGSRVAARPVDVRLLTGDTAIVVSEDGIIFPGQDAVASERLVRATWVLVRRDGGWRITSYHNSPAS